MGRMAGDLEELDIELAWTPLDLAPLAGWRRGAALEGSRRENALRVAEELEVKLTMPTRWMDSRRANAVALRLGDSPREASWRERVFSSIYESGRSLDEEGRIEELARDLDLPLEGLLDPAALAELEAETRRAHAAEVTGVPAFMLGRWPFGGIQTEFTMRSVLSRWAAKERSGATLKDRS